MRIQTIFIASTIAASLTACGGGGGGDTSSTPQGYYTQGGLMWSQTLSGTLPGDQFLWNANLMVDSASYQCSGRQSINGGAEVPNNFNKEAGWRLPLIAELKALYAVNPTPPNWKIGMVWADSSSGPQRLNFATGAITSGNGSTGLVVCVKPKI
jgi:hypothetical protein